VVGLPDWEPLTGPIQDNRGLTRAFPSLVGEDARKAVAVLPETRLAWTTFSARVGGETVAIPYRIYHNPGKIDRASLTPLQSEIVDCLLTRHHSGYVREKYLRCILARNGMWIPPFILQLVGEYVVEILQLIHQNIDSVDSSTYGEFLMENPEFMNLVEQRVISYWDCYYRTRPREEYVGFQLISSFRKLQRPT
jgi:hypothetical protein